MPPVGPIRWINIAGTVFRKFNKFTRSVRVRKPVCEFTLSFDWGWQGKFTVSVKRETPSIKPIAFSAGSVVEVDAKVWMDDLDTISMLA